MVLSKIEQLIDKYENGETTLQEEQQLKNYFSQETIAPHLEMYQPMFQYFIQTQKEQFTKDVPLKPKKTINLYRWIAVAAVAIVMMGIYLQIDPQPKPKTLADLTPQELIEYNEAKEVMALVSSKFTKASNNLIALNMVSSNFDKGTKQLNYMGEFSKATNKFLKTK